MFLIDQSLVLHCLNLKLCVCSYFNQYYFVYFCILQEVCKGFIPRQCTVQHFPLLLLVTFSQHWKRKGFILNSINQFKNLMCNFANIDNCCKKCNLLTSWHVPLSRTDFAKFVKANRRVGCLGLGLGWIEW